MLISSIDTLKINDVGVSTLTAGVEATLSTRCKRKYPASIEFVEQ